MRCDHRFKLVGYRFREERGDRPPVRDAVLVCLRCTREYLAGVDEKAPATVVEKVLNEAQAALQSADFGGG